MSVNIVTAMVLAVELDRIIGAVPGRYEDRPAYERGIDAMERAVAKADPKGALTEDWRGGLIRACGIRSTSTSGVIGACQNFIHQVERLSGLPLGTDRGNAA